MERKENVRPINISHPTMRSHAGDAPEKIARFFIEKKGVSKSDLELDVFIDICFNND